MAQAFQPTINIHAIPESIHVAQQPNLLSEQKAPAAAPRFEYKGAREKDLFISPYARSGISDPHDSDERAHSLQCLILRFENTVHANAARAIEVIAQISFRSADTVREQSIGYGVWVNSPCNCTDMDVGDTRELVLICVWTINCAASTTAEKRITAFILSGRGLMSARSTTSRL